MKKVIYIAELDADIDDVVAAEYLHRKGILQEVVCDPVPTSKDGLHRKKELEKIGVKVSDEIPTNAKYVFVGGALTKLAKYVKTNKIEYLVMNGGFVGNNIVPLDKQLKKFKRKDVVRTFNFNCDVNATHSVLKSSNIKNIVLIGKNVCHSEKNTLKGVWESERSLLEKYNVKESKLQHDMLACREGLIILNLLNEEPYLSYKKVKPMNDGLKGNMTLWGSTLAGSPYRPVLAAVDWID